MPNISIVKGLTKPVKRSKNYTAIAKLSNITVVGGVYKSLNPAIGINRAVVKKNNKAQRKKAPPKLPEKIDDNRPITERQMHCINIEVFLTHTTATPIRSHDGFSYMCCFCNENFVNPADLKDHSLMKHKNAHDIIEFMKKQRPDAFLLKLDITLLKCTICDTSIDTVDELFDHLQNEHKKRLHTEVKCQIVPFKFGGEQLQCALCSLFFTKYKILLEHMHTHFRNFVCDICDAGFVSRRAMLSHKDTHTKGSFECGECSKVFENPQRRRTHMNAVHRFMNLPSKCGICKERFTGGRLKDLHMIAVHGMSPVIRKCLACDKTFPSQQALRIHTKKYHLLERNFQCSECDMKFFTGALLKNHMLKHTGQKDFQCDVCLKWFGRKCVLTEHMRIHMNDRRFVCMHCGRGFVQKCSWRGHLRTVHGEIDDGVMTNQHDASYGP
ncbi:gastrula zinc finger protein XlCGF26.1-like [Bicyclus anynana]|uniref:Gastrula zinc finger protein XlCGF26.1-like n=1 Tax=Bicyclus anynana TaxID=110368 RepID=A0ABM3M2T5_BICAN|nr:gastrula zinc finger protein XlCGF26.1-like [Bicyclus anynana]